MLITTLVRPAIALSVVGWDASAAIRGQDCASPPSDSRTASRRSVERPARAMRAPFPAAARYSAVSFPTKPGGTVDDDVELAIGCTFRMFHVG